MSVRREIPEYDGIYFITITCSHWLHLFERSSGYAEVYKWFDHLKSKGHFIIGYVIMPNHIHVLIAFRNTQGVSINSMVGEGKRFMAYGIERRLKEKNEQEVLIKLSALVNTTDAKRGKRHEVFEPSFDWKECRNSKFIDQKLNYIHANPCRGVWNLVNTEAEYIHSSAKYYETGEQGIYWVTNYRELEDIDLTKAL
ncbi:MAG: transposase [Cyclobacteriaceae bacterium]|nr:transposase [Cyclobacteriaceae bacterium]